MTLYERPVMFIVCEHEVDIYNSRLTLVRIRVVEKPTWEVIKKDFDDFPIFDPITEAKNCEYEFAQVKSTVRGLRLFTINSVHTLYGDTA